METNKVVLLGHINKISSRRLLYWSFKRWLWRVFHDFYSTNDLL